MTVLTEFVASGIKMIITDKAVSKLKQLRSGDSRLRISVVGGGCSGLSYKMEWVDSVNAADKLTSFDDISVVVDPKSNLYLSNVTLDYEDGLNGRGFVFDNPAAKRSCGCGSSFSTS